MNRDTPRVLLLVAVLYLLVGTIGHDPWRGDDAIHFAPVYETIAHGGSWVPEAGGEVVEGFGPLYYWLAAGVAWLLQWLLPLHDGARLSTALLAGGALWSLWRSASLMHGIQARTAVVLLTIGSLGLVVHVHEMQPALGLVTAQACVLWMLVSPHRFAMALAGLAAAAAFLFAGLQGILTTWPLLLFPLLPSQQGRQRSPLQAIGALLLAMALCLAWALPASSSANWAPWMAAEIQALSPDSPAPDRVGGWFKLFGWFLWPLWPLALWSLWRAWHGAPIRHVPLLLAALMLALSSVILTGGLRPVRMLPLIVPLALLAAPAVERLRRGAAAAFDWFAVMTFSSVGLLLWLAWSALVAHWPPGLARHFRKLAPGFDLTPGLPALLLGIALVVSWGIYLWWRRPAGRDAALTWAAGMTMLWCIATSMLAPWFQHTRSYRNAAEQLAIVLQGRSASCIAGVGLGHAQRSAMDYYANLRIASTRAVPDCPLVLVYTDTRMNPRDLSRLGGEVWRYERGGGRQQESFALYARPAD